MKSNTEGLLFAKCHNLGIKEEEPKFDEGWYGNKDAKALIYFMRLCGHISEVNDVLKDFGLVSS